MDLFLVIYVILGIGQCLSAPTSNNNTFFTAINSSCYNSADLLLTQKEIFEHCQTFTEISETKSLSPKTEKNVLCLLYYKSITSCCKSHNQTVKYPTSLEFKANTYEIGPVCENIVKYSKNVFPTNPIKKAQCLYLCTEIDATFNTYIKPECLFAQYYYIQNQLPADSPQSNANNVGHIPLSASAPHLTSVAAERGTVNRDPGRVEPGLTNNTSHLSKAINSLNHSIAAVGGNKVANSTIADTIPLNAGQNQQVQIPVAGPQDANAPQSNREDITGNGPQDPNAPQSNREDITGNGPQDPNAPQSNREDITGNGPQDPNAPQSNREDITGNGPQDPNAQEPAREGSIAHAAVENANNEPSNDQHVQQGQTQLQPNQQSNESPGKPPATDNTKTDGSKSTTKAVPKVVSSSTKVEPKQEPMETDVDVEGQHGSPNLNEDAGDYVDVADNVAEGQELPSKQQATQEVAEHKVLDKKPDIVQENPIGSENLDDVDGESYFFSYFMVICVLFVLGYVGYHNRIKVMALLLEGKRNKRQQRGRRPNSANYHKLDSNLEEAISSNVTKNSNNVIY